MSYYTHLILVSVIIPTFFQHFVPPLHWCVLADICNHTWVPECAYERYDAKKRLFLDECDMFEYNCDKKKDYNVINYTECFTVDGCPTAPPCPSNPPCKNHLRHRPGDRIFFHQYPARRQDDTRDHQWPTVPLTKTGKRRYTARVKPTTAISRPTPIRPYVNYTVVLRTITFMRRGKKMVKVFRGVKTRLVTPDDNEDYLE